MMGFMKRAVMLMVCVLVGQGLMGMSCGRALDTSMTVVKPFTFQISLSEAMKSAKIPQQGDRIPNDFKTQSLRIGKTECFDVMNQPDLTASEQQALQQLNEYKDFIQAVYVNRITLSVEKGENRLSRDLPPLKVAVAPFSAGGQCGNAQSLPNNNTVGFFQTVIAKSDDQNKPLIWEPKGEKQVADLLKQLKLAIQLYVDVQVKGGDRYPKGDIVLNVDLEFAFVFNIL